MRRAVVAAAGMMACAAFAAPANAQSANASSIPRSAFFVGAGAGYAVGKFGTQSVYNKGVSQTLQGNSVIATGMADGPAVDTSFGNDSSAIPSVQFGYYQHLGNTDWLLGVKVLYNYLGLKSSTENLNIPQYGTSSAPAEPTFVGYSVTQSYAVKVGHQFTPMLIGGRSFGQGFIYAGVGPSFSQIKVDLDGVVGYATLSGGLTNISGAPQSFSASDWRLGAAATAGVTYFLTPDWFIDVNYLLTVPEARTDYFTSTFNNPGSPNTYTGTLIGTATGNVRTMQALMMSLNKAF